METIIEQIYQTGVIPVIEIDNEEQAVPLAQALSNGGLPVAEITLRTPAALAAIRLIARHNPNLLLGAGTVLNISQAQKAVDAGAKFLVSPGLDEDLVIWAQERSIPIFPGAITPTEIMRGVNLNLDLLKFFPAETMGGTKAIKAISDPFPQVRFIPTGGIKQENLVEYLGSEKIFAVGGSWMAKRLMIQEGRFLEIEQMAEQAASVVRRIRNQSGRGH